MTNRMVRTFVALYCNDYCIVSSGQLVGDLYCNLLQNNLFSIQIFQMSQSLAVFGQYHIVCVYKYSNLFFIQCLHAVPCTCMIILF